MAKGKKTGVPDVALGDSWVTGVLTCPVETLPDVLDAVLTTFNTMAGAYFPNYTIREHEATRRARASVRVLVIPTKRKKAAQALLKIASKFKIKAEVPGKQTSTGAAWIKPGTRSEYWNMERCKILHQLSMAAVACLKEGLPGPRIGSWDLSRRNFAHVFVNMLALREGFIDLAMTKQSK